MEARFKRTGERRYAVEVVVPGVGVQALSPAPGYDDDIPHDLVHYIVEAELRLETGVFGRAAKGAGTFVRRPEGGELSAREQARQRRKQQKRESGLRARDEARGREMETSERLAAICDVAWRRRHGQRADPLRKAPEISAEDAARVQRVVERLDAVAPLWRALPVGGELVFQWPAVVPIDKTGVRI